MAELVKGRPRRIGGGLAGVEPFETRADRQVDEFTPIDAIQNQQGLFVGIDRRLFVEIERKAGERHQRSRLVASIHRLKRIQGRMAAEIAQPLRAQVFVLEGDQELVVEREGLASEQ
jgi:hypothetical protein